MFLEMGRAGAGGADVAGGDLAKTPPAAADLEHRHARLQVHHPGQGGVFGLLRGLERGVRPLEPGRRIGHRGVEPGLVEGVAQVVMGVDVLLRSALAVAVAPMGQPVDRHHQPIAVEQAADVVVVLDQGLQQGGQMGAVPFAGHIGFREADVAGGQDAAGEAVVFDVQHAAGAGAGAVQHMGLAIGQVDGQAAEGPVRRQQTQQHGEHARGAGGGGLDIDGGDTHAGPSLDVVSHGRPVRLVQ